MMKIGRVLAGTAFLLLASMGAIALKPGQTPGERAGKGSIDYDKGRVYAIGLGAVSSQEPNEGKAYLRGRTFAKLDAYRNLLAVVDHVKIDSRTTGKDYEAQHDEIKATIQGVVRGADIVAEREIRVGRSTLVEVTVAAPLYGSDGLAQAFIAPREESEAERPSRDPAPERTTDPAPTITEDPQIKATILRPSAPGLPRKMERFTSVIIDTRGLGVERCMSPKIRREDGSEVWGTVNANYDFVIEHGIVAYARTQSDALENRRTGDNPLTIRAIGKAGGRFNSDAVLSNDDADFLVEANRRGKFLDRYNVIFLVDPSK